MNLNLKSLIGKVDEATRSALEGAAGLCVSRTPCERVRTSHCVVQKGGLIGDCELHHAAFARSLPSRSSLIGNRGPVTINIVPSRILPSN